MLYDKYKYNNSVLKDIYFSVAKNTRNEIMKGKLFELYWIAGR